MTTRAALRLPGLHPYPTGWTRDHDVPQTTPTPPFPGGLLTAKQAAAWLQISLRQLVDRADIPRLDVAPSGAERSQWRYRIVDLEAFAEARVIAPYAQRPALKSA